MPNVDLFAAITKAVKSFGFHGNITDKNIQN